MEYTNRTNLFYDLRLWIAWKNNQTLYAGHFPKLSSERWQWFVDNWSNFYPKFKTQAGGDGYLEDSLEQWDSNVVGWRSGAKVNPLESLAFYEKISEFLFNVTLTEMSITSSEQVFVNKEIQRVSKFTSQTFQNMNKFLKDERDAAFDAIGLGDPLYSSIYGKSEKPKKQDWRMQDLDTLGRAIEIERFIQGIILDFKYNQQTEVNLLAFDQTQLTDDSDIQLETAYRSYILVPFEQSLEQMAQSYLNSRQRWYDLVTTNYLKPPYVDKVGEKVTIVEPGVSSSVRIPGTYEDRVRIGQSVKIGSLTVPEEIRKILSVRDNGDGSFTIQLSGSADLNKLKPRNSAYVRLYKPLTLQEFSFVRIPFTIQPQITESKSPHSQVLKELDKALYDFGVDIAVSSNTNDFVFTQSGDLKMQYGIAAVRQALYNLIRTELETLPLHPDYGIENVIGDRMYGGNTAARVAELIVKAVRRDDRYTSVEITDITANPNGVVMRLEVGIPKVSELIPFSFQI